MGLTFQKAQAKRCIATHSRAASLRIRTRVGRTSSNTASMLQVSPNDKVHHRENGIRSCTVISRVHNPHNAEHRFPREMFPASIHSRSPEQRSPKVHTHEGFWGAALSFAGKMQQGVFGDEASKRTADGERCDEEHKQQGGRKGWTGWWTWENVPGPYCASSAEAVDTGDFQQIFNRDHLL